MKGELKPECWGVTTGRRTAALFFLGVFRVLTSPGLNLTTALQNDNLPLFRGLEL